MNDSTLLHQLLHEALVEIRTEGRESKNKAVVHLADLFHNVVLQMGRAAQGDGSYKEVLESLREQAQQKGCERWMEQRMAELADGE